MEGSSNAYTALRWLLRTSSPQEAILAPYDLHSNITFYRTTNASLVGAYGPPLPVACSREQVL